MMNRTSIVTLALLAAIMTPAAAQTPGPLGGAFVWFGVSPADEGITYQQIPAHLDELQSLGISNVIIASTRKRINTSCTPSSCPCGSTFQWAYGMDPNLPEPSNKLRAIVSGAQARGMRVYIGLVSSEACENWWTHTTDMPAETSSAVSLIKSTLSTWGLYGSVDGWYIPDEADKCQVEGGLRDYFQAVAAKIRENSPSGEGKKIVASPYLRGVRQWGSPSTLANNCGALLSQTEIDVLAVQDSVATDATDPGTYDHVPPAYPLETWFTTLRDHPDIGKSRLWAVNELSGYGDPYNYSGVVYQSAALMRLNQQLWHTRSGTAPTDLTSMRVAWLQQNQMGTVVNFPLPGAERLKASYRALYLGQGAYHPIQSYTWATPPDGNYADTSPIPTKMKDTFTGDPRFYWHSKWVGVPYTAIVQLDLGVSQTVHWITVHFLHDPGPGIRIPARLTFRCKQGDTGGFVDMGSEDLSLPPPPSCAPVPTPGCEQEPAGEYGFGNRHKLNHPTQCRFVEIQMDNAWWTFLSEIELFREP